MKTEKSSIHIFQAIYSNTAALEDEDEEEDQITIVRSNRSGSSRVTSTTNTSYGNTQNQRTNSGRGRKRYIERLFGSCCEYLLKRIMLITPRGRRYRREYQQRQLWLRLRRNYLERQSSIEG
jgi:hypothetical protein